MKLNHRLRILVADDSPIILVRILYLLKPLQDIDVIGQAQTVEETKQLFLRQQPDLVILDIQMPDGSGIDALRFIKQASPTTIVMMLTNYPYLKHRQKCLEAKADYFFDKSTEFQSIVEVVKSLTKIKGSRHEP